MSTKHPPGTPPPSPAQVRARLRVLRKVRDEPPLTDLLDRSWSEEDIAAWMFLLREGYTYVKRTVRPSGQADRLSLTALGEQYLDDLRRDEVGPNGA